MGSIQDEPQRALMLQEVASMQRHVLKHKLHLGDGYMAILLSANSIILHFYETNSFQRNSHLVFAAAAFLMAQKMHFASNSVQRIATFFVEACLHQLESRHSVLLAQPLARLSQIRREYVEAKTQNSPELTKIRARWDAEHTAVIADLVKCIKYAEVKLYLMTEFKNLPAIGRELAMFRQIEEQLDLKRKSEWTEASNNLRDIDLLNCAAATLSPRQVALQFLLQSAGTSQAVLKYGPTAVALAALKTAVDTKRFQVPDIAAGSNLISSVLEKVKLAETIPESQVRDCWKYALKASQAYKQQLQQLPAPSPVSTHVLQSPVHPTKISPNLSTVSATTPLSATPAKRCRSNDGEAPDSAQCAGLVANTPRTVQNTPNAGKGKAGKGIDAAQRPEHDGDRHKARRRTPEVEPVGKAAKRALPDPPSPESLEEGELRSP
eukprot:jgi/Ulvmu1/9075/UM005_0170.1